MKKHKLILALSILMLASCQSTASSIDSISNSSSTSIVTTSNTVSITSSESDKVTTSSQSSTSTSVSTSEVNAEVHNLNISQIREKCLTLADQENEVGVAESDYVVHFKAKLIACVTAISTKAGYGNAFKILVMDQTGYIYLKVSAAAYDYLTKYEEQKGIYEIKGNASLYLGEPEVTLENTDKPTYLEGEDITANYDIAKKCENLTTVYEDISKLRYNCKGVTYSSLVTVDLKCLARDFENANVYMTDGEKIIILHGSNKLYTKFIVDSVYRITGALSLYNFRPGLELVKSELLETEITFDYSDTETKTCADFYKYTYKTDDNGDYSKYTNVFMKPYKVTGYVNYYEKNGEYYLVLEDTYNENRYTTYQTASAAKAIFMKNSNCIGITDINSTNNSDLVDYLDENPVSILVFPNLWNTQKYFQTYFYDFID